ncbi:MAG: hypothetical protein ACR2NO_03835 [Chloroflexota bacterium]
MLICGASPAYILHHIPVTQRYAYLAYPAVYVAAVEGLRLSASLLARLISHPAVSRHTARSILCVMLFVVMLAFQLLRANADVFGEYGFVLAYGGP